MQQTTKRAYGMPVKIAEYFRGNPDKEITVLELQREFSLSKDQVHTAMHRISGIEIEIVRRGQIWRYNTGKTLASVSPMPHIEVENVATARMVFEFVGRTKNDNAIVRDLDSNLFILNPLDV